MMTNTKSSNPPSPSAWPIATPFRGASIPLSPVIEAEFSSAQLRELARWLGATPKGNSRIGLVEQVVSALNERIARTVASPEALLEGLTAEQQDFARRLLTARDYELPFARSIAASLLAKSSERPNGYQLDADRHLTELIESLRRRALLFPTRALLPIGSRDVYYQWLPLNGARPPVVQWNVEAPDERRAADARPLPTVNFLESFETFLNAILRNGITLRPPLRPHAQATRLIWLRDWEHDVEEAERVLRSRPNWAPDPHTGITVPMLGPIAAESLATLENQTGLSGPHIEFLFAIACALQLIESPANQEEMERRVRIRSSALEEWLVLSDGQKLRRAWTAWSEQIMDGLEVRSAMDALKPARTFRVMRALGARYLTPNLLAAEWCALRRYVLRILRGLPSERWVSWRDLQTKLFDFYPECVWAFASKMEWWFAPANRGARLNLLRVEEWRASVGLILEHIIRDSLAWFGAVEVCLAEDGYLDAFRVTEVGEWLIEAREGKLPAVAAPAARTIEPIEWLDEHTLRVPPAPDRAALVSVVRRSAERGPAPFTYIFTAASIERALSEGMGFADLAGQFEHAGVSLTRAVSDQFKLIARRHGRVRVYQSLTVLELSDDFAARELAASTSLMKYVVYQLSPRTFVLQEADLDVLIKELQSKGYTPRVK
jgi:hypothetical protein